MVVAEEAVAEEAVAEEAVAEAVVAVVVAVSGSSDRPKPTRRLPEGC